MPLTGLTLNYLGAVTGAVGVMIAIYLQLISPKRCPPKYVLFYFLFGSGLMLSHTSGVIFDGPTAFTLRIIGYLILIAIQIWSAYYIYQRLDGEGPVLPVEQVISTKHK